MTSPRHGSTPDRRARRGNPADEDGFVLAAVLVLIALLGVGVGTYALTTSVHVTLGEALRRSGRGDIVAEAGLEVWLSRVRLDPPAPDTDGVDHFGEPWGWGGKLLPGVSYHEPVYVPSLESRPREQTIGFFRIARVEDEGGKINLRDPPADPPLQVDSLEGGGATDRSFGPVRAGRVLGFTREHPDQLLTLGGLLGVHGIGPASLREIRRVYSNYRRKNGDHRINVNTAPYESLRGLQVNPTGTSPIFMTEPMAEAVIARRSCSPIDRAPHRIRREDYSTGCGSSRPFRTVTELCRHLNLRQPGGVIGQVNCEVLKRHATTNSNGFLRAVVRGVTLDDDGGTVTETCLDVVVDRRGLHENPASPTLVHRQHRSCPARFPG